MLNDKIKHLNRTLYFRRAKWHEQKDQTLSALLIDQHRGTNVGERTFNLSGNVVKGAEYKIDDNAIYLHISSCIPDEAANVIDNNHNVEKSTTKNHSAPENNNYVDGDIFAYIKENNVVLCTNGKKRESLLTSYCKHTLNKDDNNGTIFSSLELVKIAKLNKLKMIQDEGVKSIQLGVSLYEASRIRLSNHTSRGIPNILKDISSVFLKDQTHDEIQEYENLNVKLSLNFDGRNALKKKNKVLPDFGKSGLERLEEISEDVILDESDIGNSFQIVTKRGNIINSNEIRVSQNCKIEKNGNSLNKIDAWNQLKSYYDNLATEGILNQ